MRICLKLDAIDIKIMAELQRNARVTNIELARGIGLSPTPVWRRVHVLERCGAIKRYYAQLDSGKLGFEISAFVSVGLKSQHAANLVTFEDTIRKWPDLREIYAVQGETDFLLKCVARNFLGLQDFIETRLLTLPNVRNVRMSCSPAISDPNGIARGADQRGASRHSSGDQSA